MAGNSPDAGRAGAQCGGSPKVYLAAPVDARLAELFAGCASVVEDISASDVIVHGALLWARKDTPAVLEDVARRYRDRAQKVAVFIVNDYEWRYRHHTNLVLFRTSLRGTLQRPNDIVLPYAWDCVDTSYPPLPDSAKPIVSFCGLVSRHRRRLLDAFERAPGVTANFIRRDKFWGGNPHDPKLVREFDDNMRGGQFIVSQRGAGNFSMRFYQTLAAGRIPVLVDSDMRLPFDDEIDWRRRVVFAHSAEDCVARVIDIFRSGQTVAMQQDCRRLYDTYFAKPQLGARLVSAALRHTPPKRSLAALLRGVRWG